MLSFDPGFPEPLLVYPDHLTAERVVLNLSRTKVGPHAEVFFCATRDTNVIVAKTRAGQALQATKTQARSEPVC